MTILDVIANPIIYNVIKNNIPDYVKDSIKNKIKDDCKCIIECSLKGCGRIIKKDKEIIEKSEVIEPKGMMKCDKGHKV
jgi:hypothetical protein